MSKPTSIKILLLAILILAYSFGGAIWATAIGGLGVLSYLELINLKETTMKYPKVIKYLGIVSLLILIYSTFDGYTLEFGLSYLGISLTFLLLFIPSLFIDKYNTKEAFALSGIVLFLGMIFNTLILFEGLNKLILIYLGIITISTKVFNLLIGNLVGKHKITPNMTLEGLTGSLFCGITISSLFHVMVLNSSNVLYTIFISSVLCIFSVLGNLLFNKIKKENNIKSFSKFIPKFGGILDYIDSLLIIVLVYIIIINL